MKNQESMPETISYWLISGGGGVRAAYSWLSGYPRVRSVLPLLYAFVCALPYMMSATFFFLLYLHCSLRLFFFSCLPDNGGIDRDDDADPAHHDDCLFWPLTRLLHKSACIILLRKNMLPSLHTSA